MDLLHISECVGNLFTLCKTNCEEQIFLLSVANTGHYQHFTNSVVTVFISHSQIKEYLGSANIFF